MAAEYALSTTWRPPTGDASEYQPAGVHWDVVCVASSVAWLAHYQLGVDSGCVFEEPVSRVWRWLVPVGSTAPWPRMDGVHRFSRGTSVSVPPAGRRTGAPRWIVEPGRGRWLTDAMLLHQAVTTAAAHIGQVPVEGVLCAGCGRHTYAPVLVRQHPSASGPDRAVHACPDCAPALTPGPGPAEVTAR